MINQRGIYLDFFVQTTFGVSGGHIIVSRFDRLTAVLCEGH
jgi:hypothetical protein